MKYVGVDVGEKTTFWLHVVAHGTAGARVRARIPIPRPIVWCTRWIAFWPTARRSSVPVVDEFLREMAPYEPPERAREYRNIRKALEDKKFQQEVEKDESLNFLLRDTISLTMMGGSEQTNVIPPEAWANLDVRILPGGDPKALLEEIRRVVDDPNVTIEPLNAEFREANYSPTNTALYDAIRKVSSKLFSRYTGGSAHHQRIYGEPAISSAGYQRLRFQSLHRDGRRRATRSMATMSAFAWRKCGGGRGFCLTWWRRWRRRSECRVMCVNFRRSVSHIAR